MSKNFQELLAELSAVSEQQETMAKSVTAAPEQDETDETVAAAAAEAGAAPAADGELEDEPEGQAPADEVLGKSFEVTGENGEKHEAFDATALIKSLIDRQGTAEETLAKALTGFTGVIQKQGEMIKSLHEQVRAISSQGRGRKTVLTVAEKPDVGATMAKSQDAESGMTPSEFFAKANTAFDEGRISGKDLNVISVCLRSNHPVDADLIQRVVKV